LGVKKLAAALEDVAALHLPHRNGQSHVALPGRVHGLRQNRIMRNANFKSRNQ
jgi:hypothetical protein